MPSAREQIQALSAMDLMEKNITGELTNLWIEAMKGVHVDASILFTQGRDVALKKADRLLWLVMTSFINKPKMDPTPSPTQPIEKTVVETQVEPPLLKKVKKVKRACRTNKNTIPYQPPREAIIQATRGMDDSLSQYYNQYMSLPSDQVPRGVHTRLRNIKRVLDSFGITNPRGITGITRGAGRVITTHIVFNSVIIKYPCKTFKKEDAQKLTGMIQTQINLQYSFSDVESINIGPQKRRRNDSSDLLGILEDSL